MSSFLFSSYLLHFNCKFVPLYISSLSPVLSRFNCVMDNLPYSPSKTPVRLFIYLLFDSVVHPLRLVW